MGTPERDFMGDFTEDFTDRPWPWSTQSVEPSTLHGMAGDGMDEAMVGRALLELHASLQEIEGLTVRLDRARARQRVAIGDAIDSGAPLSAVARVMGVSVQRISNIAQEHRQRLERAELSADELRDSLDTDTFQVLWEQYMAVRSVEDTVIPPGKQSRTGAPAETKSRAEMRQAETAKRRAAKATPKPQND